MTNGIRAPSPNKDNTKH